MIYRTTNRFLRPWPIPKTLDEIVIFVTAILALSSIGSLSLLKFGGNFYPEPAILLFIAYSFLKKGDLHDFVSRTLKSKLFTASFVFLIFMAIIGIAANGDILAVYADLRSCIILAFAYSSLDTRDESSLIKSGVILFSFCFYTFLGNSLSGFFTAPTAEASKQAFPALAIAYCFFFAIKSRAYYLNPYLVSVCFILTVIMAIMSFYRITYLQTIFCAAVFFFYIIGITFSSGKENSYRLHGLVIFSLIFVAMLLFNGIYFAIFDFLSSSESRYIQSIGKTNDLLDVFYGGLYNVKDGDYVRVLYYENILDNIRAFSVPGGLGQKVIEGNWGSIWSDDRLVGSTFSSKDGGLIFMAAHFGILCSLPILTMFFIRLGRNLVATRNAFDFLCLTALAATAIVFFVMSGVMFVQTGFSFGFGASLALIFSWHKLDALPVDMPRPRRNPVPQRGSLPRMG